MAEKIFNLPESTSRTQTHTVIVDKLKSINSITTNTGQISVTSTDRDEVTFQVSGGSYTRRVQTGGSYTPADTKHVTNQPRANYNSGGYSGTLSRYVHSGSNTPADDKFVNDYYVPRSTQTYYRYDGSKWVWLREDMLGSWPSSVSYDSGGYTGTLAPAGYEFYSDKKSYVWPTNPKSGDVFMRYTGVTNKEYRGTVYRPASDTRVYRYRGDVTKPASDTRTYSYYYAYNVTIDYEESGFEAKIKIGGSIRESTDGWVKINGSLREIDSMVVKVGGVLREL